MALHTKRDVLRPKCSARSSRHSAPSTTFTVIMLALDMQQFISFYNDYHILSR